MLLVHEEALKIARFHLSFHPLCRRNTKKYGRRDKFKTRFIHIFLYFFLLYYHLTFRESLPFSDENYLHTRMGLFEIRSTGSSTPHSNIPEVVASPPSKRSRCDRVCPSSSTLRASPSLSFAPPVVSAAPKAVAKREGNKET